MENTQSAQQQPEQPKEKWRTDETRFSINNLVCGGLLAIFLIIFQDFIQTGVTDIFSYVVVFSLAVAMPCLAGCLISNLIEVRYPYKYGATLINIIYGIGLLSGFVGLVATFGHISLIAAGIFFVISIIAGVVCVLYTRQLSRDPEGLHKWQ